MRHTNPPIEYQQVQGMNIGLTREQVLSDNFGDHTIKAIKREIEINSLDLQKAFEKYKDLNNIEVDAMTKFGLTREQVLSYNFGDHTSRAIAREIEAGFISQESFEKYKNLNNIQVDAMTKFGLTREQVLSYNFGDHTSRAIAREIEAGFISQESFEKYYKGLDSRGVDDILLTRSPILGLLITHNKIKAILSESPAEKGGRQSEQEIEKVIHKLINQDDGQDKCKMFQHIELQFIKYDDKDNFSFNTANIEYFCQENKASPQIIKYLTEKVAELIFFEDCVKIDPQYKEGESVYFAGKLVKNYKSAPVESAIAEQVQGQNSCCAIS